MSRKGGSFISDCSLGFRNMFRKENHAWYGTKKLLIQAIAWTIIITGSVAFMLYVFSTLPVAAKPEIIDSYGTGAAALQLFFNIAGFAAVAGVIILNHDSIISERLSGTAEWVLSKPVSRKAFVLAKLSAGITWMTIIIILLQGILLVLVVNLFKGEIEIIPFAKGLGIVWLECFFYICLVIFLGTVFASRGMVLGTAFLFFLLGMLVPLLIEQSYYFMPWKLPEIAFSFSMSIAWSAKTFLPIILTAIWSLLLIAGSIRRMEKLEI